MTTNIRTTLSSATALGLVSFTATSALISGLFATTTVVGFALLAVYGVFEIALLSYAAPKLTAARPAPAPAAVVRTTRRVPALIEFPVTSRTACRSLAA